MSVRGSVAGIESYKVRGDEENIMFRRRGSFRHLLGGDEKKLLMDCCCGVQISPGPQFQLIHL